MESLLTTSLCTVRAMDVDLDNSSVQDIVPKLRKNRRIENKWGTQYFLAVHETVFGLQCLPYVPTERPASLSEEIVESDPLYVCKYCKDCFRFQSSFEAHNKRRSWILGFWCHNCFITVCTHTTTTRSACLICIKKDSHKRLYLRTRGLTKNQKLGSIKVFYNQCQFFEHMKMHGLSIVDMGDIMLMPLPTDINDSDWSTELEIICEALMEHTFLLRLHIMDWLRLYNLEDNWWKLNNGKSNHSLIQKVIKGYQGRQLFKTLDKSTINQVDFPDTVRNINKISLKCTDTKNKDADSNFVNIMPDKNVSENEDNPCMSTDITFVDCGPTPQCFEPESSMSYTPRRRLTVVTQSEQESHLVDTIRTNYKKKVAPFKDLNLFETDMTCENIATVKTDDKNYVIKQSCKGSVQQYKIAQQSMKKITGNNVKSVAKTTISKTDDNPIKISIPLSANNIILPKTNLDHLEQDLQSSITNSNANSISKILTIQGPKNADISSIISQLPSHFISNTKVVFIGQDSNNIIVHNKNEITGKKSHKSVLDNSSTDFTSQNKICDSINIKKQQVTSKIIIKDGKKYLIQHTAKDPQNSSNLPTESNTSKAVKLLTPERSTPMSTMSNSDVIEDTNVKQITSLHNDRSLITPSSSSSELPSNSNFDLHVKTSIASTLQKAPHFISPVSVLSKKLLFETVSLVEEDGNLYMKIKIVDRISREGFRDTCEVVPKYREKMIDEFYQLNSYELKKRIDHLKHVSEENIKILNFVSMNVRQEKFRSIHTFQHILKECLHKHKDENVKDKKYDDRILNEWELKKSCKTLCPLCNKLMKPNSYIAGFSKLSKDDDAYCFCYKQVCKECLSYQGTPTQFIAHQNLHKRCSPFVCPDCNTRFACAKSCEIHIWTVCFHKLKKRIFACKICEIDGFRDMESITRHFVIMHSDTKIACKECTQVFSTYGEYVQHHKTAHSLNSPKRNPIRLVTCKLGDFTVRYENYMSYLEMHPGIRKLIWLKCPFCSLVTVENKHMKDVLNTHLRNKHMDLLPHILSQEALDDMFGTESHTTDINAVSEDSTDMEPSFANEASCTDGTIVPKIVNTRTISSEIFERGSQDTEDTWFINVDGSINPRTTKKVDNKETEKSLPKILAVRSMADLKPSTPKKIITKTSTETKEKLSFQSPSNSSEIVQTEIVQTERVQTEDGQEEDPLAYEDVEETPTKLDDGESNYLIKEKTGRTKDSDKSINESIFSRVFVKSPLADTDDVHVNSLESNEEVSSSESISKASTDGRIKVIDIRKICKPDVEPLLVVEMCNTQVKDENASCTASIRSIPKPPPLTRIPQHLLKATEANRSRKSGRFLAYGATDKPKARIAIHGPTDTQEGDIDYLCHLCDERINTSWSVVREHFLKNHSHEYTLAIITPQLLRMSPDFINDGYKKFISKKRKSDSALFVSKKKRRWTSKKHEVKDANAPIGLCVERETAEDGEGNFKCKKCDQRCTDMSNLRKHIAANHRLKGRYLICLECGENFVVAPSLQMHLKAFHGIEDPINYMSENPFYAPGIDGDAEAEGRTTEANQCHVCMAVFEDKAAVDKHLRVHGMAFLNRKRIEARNAMKSPEKKVNIEEDKQSTVKDGSKEIVKRDKPAVTILEKLYAAI